MKDPLQLLHSNTPPEPLASDKPKKVKKTTAKEQKDAEKNKPLKLAPEQLLLISKIRSFIPEEDSTDVSLALKSIGEGLMSAMSIRESIEIANFMLTKQQRALIIPYLEQWNFDIGEIDTKTKTSIQRTMPEGTKQPELLELCQNYLQLSKVMHKKMILTTAMAHSSSDGRILKALLDKNIKEEEEKKKAGEHEDNPYTIEHEIEDWYKSILEDPNPVRINQSENRPSLYPDHT